MKAFTQQLEKDTKALGKLVEDLHKPFAGAFDEDPDPYGVIEDEINQDHANDNRI